MTATVVVAPGAVTSDPGTWPSMEVLDMADRICSIEGCESPHYARGWCSAHYQWWRKHGGPDGGLARLTPAERFWAKVDKTGPGGCWLWTAAADPKGYGWFGVARRMVRAHRWSYEVLVGPIPRGLTLDHLCRVTCCVNPSHLEPVTSRVNTLRGEAPAAKNARKTHCAAQGHEFTPENTLMEGTRRRCRECTRRRQAARRARMVESTP